MLRALFFRTDVDLFFDDLVERDKRFRFGDSGDVLQGIDQDIHQVLLVGEESSNLRYELTDGLHSLRGVLHP